MSRHAPALLLQPAEPVAGPGSGPKPEAAGFILDEVSKATIRLGHDIVDVAGFLERVDGASARQVTRLTEARDSARGLLRGG